MIVIDSSILAAIVFGEPDADSLAGILADAEELVVSAVTRVEAGIVVEGRLGVPGRQLLEGVMDKALIAVVPVDGQQSDVALTAWRRFGRGRHPAKLNLGDCFSYALAKTLRAPLLYKGDDFSQTDIESAL